MRANRGAGKAVGEGPGFGCVTEGLLRDLQVQIEGRAMLPYAIDCLREIAPHLDSWDWLRLLAHARMLALISRAPSATSEAACE